MSRSRLLPGKTTTADFIARSIWGGNPGLGDSPATPRNVADHMRSYKLGTRRCTASVLLSCRFCGRVRQSLPSAVPLHAEAAVRRPTLRGECLQNSMKKRFQYAPGEDWKLRSAFVSTGGGAIEPRHN